MLDVIELLSLCAPQIAPATMHSVISVESSRNPFAIGVVGGKLTRQPKNKAEAIATIKSLEQNGYNYSLGIAQVNKHNLTKYGLTLDAAFEPCDNVKTGAKILEECYQRAQPIYKSKQASLEAALSCYYSGNFTRGFIPDKPGEKSYVQKVLAQTTPVDVVQPIPVVPAPVRTQTINNTPTKTTEDQPVLLRAEKPQKNNQDAHNSSVDSSKIVF